MQSQAAFSQQHLKYCLKECKLQLEKSLFIMAISQLKIQGHSIILLGNFNPIIFQPAWFSAKELLAQAEAEAAKVEIIHPDAAIFSLEWMRLEVTRERLMVETTQESYYEVIRDLILGMFSLLSHTPLKKMGINTNMHFLIENEEQWHNIGHRLAPKDLWKDILQSPGMGSLTMIESTRRDGLKGSISVKIEPSVKVLPWGVFINVNDHIEAKDADAIIGSDEIMNILRSSWKDCHERAKNIIYTLLERLL